MGFVGHLPYVKIAIENGPFIVDLPIKNCDFSIKFLGFYGD